MTATCRHCGTTLTRGDVSEQWRDAKTMSGGCTAPGYFYHQPRKESGR